MSHIMHVAQECEDLFAAAGDVQRLHWGRGPTPKPLVKDCWDLCNVLCIPQYPQLTEHEAERHPRLQDSRHVSTCGFYLPFA